MSSNQRERGRPKRQYSRAFATKGKRRAYTIVGIPAGFWLRVQAQARRDGVSLRAMILDHLAAWLQAAR